jgi:hypothetical protein
VTLGVLLDGKFIGASQQEPIRRGGGGVAKWILRETINPEILRETKNSRDPRSKRGS